MRNDRLEDRAAQQPKPRKRAEDRAQRPRPDAERGLERRTGNGFRRHPHDRSPR